MLRACSTLLTLVLALPAAALAPTAGPVPPSHPAWTTASGSAKQAVFPTTPRLKPDGGKWRLGYLESGDYSEYPDTLRAIIQGLQKLGWLSVPDIPEQLNGRQMWDFLVKHARSDTLEFVADAWWQPGNFDPAQRPVVREAIRQRLQERHDIDLILAMGTWAGQDMVALGAPVPTVVASASDAVGSRIVASASDSGLDNLHARVQPERYQRQVQLFFDIVKFKTLGMVYEDSLEGRSYAAVPAVEQAARKDGFQMKSCTTGTNELTTAQATRNVVECYRKLSQEVDAVYVTTHRGITTENIGEIAGILRKAKVPSFAMLDPAQVRAGLLMSLAQADYSYVGLFHAEVIARILNGAKPRQLSQIWVDPAKIALNLDTARIIGFDPPVDILLAADEVYTEQGALAP
ncbi:ABC transporter substrate-binding protein [Alcaligenes sp. WGS1538]|uniref:ABC transporter substrate-binding protein n=1 Tax=Alcaligenes sp. WGS1538 TaxID=3366811 RepID=UPI00372D1677